MLAHSCNPSPWEAKAGDQEFKLIFSYVVNPEANLRSCEILAEHAPQPPTPGAGERN